MFGDIEIGYSLTRYGRDQWHLIYQKKWFSLCVEVAGRCFESAQVS